MDVRILVAGKANESGLALLLSFVQCLGGAVRTNKEVRIVFEDSAVNLPEIDMLGLQPMQVLFKHSHRK